MLMAGYQFSGFYRMHLWILHLPAYCFWLGCNETLLSGIINLPCLDAFASDGKLVHSSIFSNYMHVSLGTWPNVPVTYPLSHFPLPPPRKDSGANARHWNTNFKLNFCGLSLFTSGFCVCCLHLPSGRDPHMKSNRDVLVIVLNKIRC